MARLKENTDAQKTLEIARSKGIESTRYFFKFDIHHQKYIF